jgi:hypothetical protein
MTPRDDGPHSVVDRRYWLAHSDGFRVDGPAGRIGTVLRTIEGSEVLIVRTGILGSHSVMVPFADVERLEPWRERLALSHAPARRGPA